MCSTIGAESVEESRNDEATDCKASVGQGVNQSITVSLTNAGKFRHRVRKLSPT